MLSRRSEEDQRTEVDERKEVDPSSVRVHVILRCFEEVSPRQFRSCRGFLVDDFESP